MIATSPFDPPYVTTTDWPALALGIVALRRDRRCLRRTHGRVHRLAVILQTHLLFLSATLLVMLEDDAAMLAFMFS